MEKICIKRAWLLDNSLMLEGHTAKGKFIPNDKTCGFSYKKIQHKDIGEILFYDKEKAEVILEKEFKLRLKEKLLNIPINYTAFREKHRLARDTGIELEKIEVYLNELCEKGILLKKTQYKCPDCHETTTVSDEMLEEILEDGYYECDNCCDFVNPYKNKTGYVFYDIKNKEFLINWDCL